MNEITMVDLEYRHVDVFSRRALRGNGLVVVLHADNLPTAVMQEVTREVRQFETAFLSDVNLTGRSAGLRIFTEDEELDFAGHPVLRRGRAAHLAARASCRRGLGVECGTAHRPGRTRGAAGWVDPAMDQGVLYFGPAIASEQARACSDALNLAPGQLHPALPVQVVCTGLPYLIVPIQAGLERARISHPHFEQLLASAGAKFVYVLDPTAPRAAPGTTPAGSRTSRPAAQPGQPPATCCTTACGSPASPC
jgi:trans-2,3-dihydro-3-hydroxyanthranilate isomerase